MLPVTYGDSTIHMSKIDCLVNGPQQPIETKWGPTSAEERKIATLISENLVDDMATIQLRKRKISSTLLTPSFNYAFIPSWVAPVSCTHSLDFQIGLLSSIYPFSQRAKPNNQGGGESTTKPQRPRFTRTMLYRR